MKIYLLMPKFQQKIINEIKQLTLKQVTSIADFLFLLSQILIQKISIRQITRYLTQIYSHNKIQWQTIPTVELFQIYKQAIQYITQNRQKWKKLDQIAELQNQLLFQQKIKIKKTLKQKAITKEDLIDTYLQQIRRNKAIILKNKDQRESTKYLQNIEGLQKRIQIIKNQNFLNQTEFHQQKQDFQIKEFELIKISQQFEFKKKFFQEEDIMDQNQNLRSQILKLQKRTTELLKRFSNIYHHYSKQNYNPSQTFENNKKNLQSMDLRIFLKYYRDFNLFQKQGQKYKVPNITNLFKKIALNGKHIDLQKFIQIHSQLFSFSFKSLNENNINQQLLKYDEILKRKRQIQCKLVQLEQIRSIYSQQKIYQVLNILKIKKIKKQKNVIVSQNLNRIIDKTSDDYAKTRQMLYQELKRNKYQKLKKDKFQNPNSQQKFKLTQDINFKYIESYSNSAIQKNNVFKKNTYLNKNIFQTIIEQANYELKNFSHIQNPKNNPQNRRQRSQTVKKSKSSFSLSYGINSQFTLPRLTRLSDQRIQSQSIYKSLEYLNGTLSKKQNQKIKRILSFEKNLQSNKIQNDYLKKYFDHQKYIDFEKEKEHFDQKQKKVSQQRKNCPKFKSSDYEPFMKF